MQKKVFNFLFLILTFTFLLSKAETAFLGETAENPGKIELSSSSNNEHTEQQEAAYDYSSLLLAAIVLLILLVVALYFKQRKIKRSEGLLESKNLEIEKQKEELEELNEELQKRYSELLESEKELRKTTMMKDRFFSVIASDLKKPFSSLLTSTYLLSHNFDKLQHKEIKKKIGQLDETTRKLFTFLENLLLWSKIQTSSIDLMPEKLNISELTDNCICLFKNVCDNKGIIIDSEINKDILIYADSNLTMTILRNLLANAIKYSNPGSIVKCSTEEDGSYIKFAVSDNGPGIEADKAANIFDLDSQSASNGHSLGLGLILTRELVEIQDGMITLDTQPGKGSSFIVSFPKSRELFYQ